MSKTDAEIVEALLAFETALAMLERFNPDRHAEDVAVLAMFTVADDGIYELIDTLSSHPLTEKQSAAFLARMARFKALDTANIRDALARYGCSPAPRRLAN